MCIKASDKLVYLSGFKHFLEILFFNSLQVKTHKIILMLKVKLKFEFSLNGSLILNGDACYWKRITLVLR